MTIKMTEPTNTVIAKSSRFESQTNIMVLFASATIPPSFQISVDVSSVEASNQAFSRADTLDLLQPFDIDRIKLS